jgi:hypothetical protein
MVIQRRNWKPTRRVHSVSTAVQKLFPVVRSELPRGASLPPRLYLSVAAFGFPPFQTLFLHIERELFGSGSSTSPPPAFPSLRSSSIATAPAACRPGGSFEDLLTGRDFRSGKLSPSEKTLRGDDNPLVVESYRTGKDECAKQSSLEAVQPHRPGVQAVRVDSCRTSRKR